jgi:hypothetical protein
VLQEARRDRLSADALRNPVIAELVARGERCGETLVVEDRRQSPQVGDPQQPHRSG